MSEEPLDFFDQIPERTVQVETAPLDRPWTEERWFLTHPDTARTLTLTDDAKAIWDGINGERTVRDVLAVVFEKRGSPVDIEALLGRLEREGFIRWKHGVSGIESDTGRIDQEARRILNRLVCTEFHLPILTSFFNRVGPRWGMLVISTNVIYLFCALGLVSCYRLFLLFNRGEYTPLQVGGSVLAGLVGLAVGLIVLPFFAECLFGLGIPRLGLRIREVAVRFQFGLPTPRIRTEDPVSLSPSAFARLLIARTASYLGMAGVAVIVAALLIRIQNAPLIEDALLQIATVALLLCFLSLSPILPTQAYRSLCGYLHVKALPRLAFQYVGRELASVFSRRKEETVHGKILLVFAAYTCVWCIFAAKLASFVFRSELPLLLTDAFSEQNKAVLMIALLTLLLVAAGILFFVLGSILFVVWQIAHWVWIHVYPKNQGRKILVNIPVFAVLALLVWTLGEVTAVQVAVPLLFGVSVLFFAATAIRLRGSVWSVPLWVKVGVSAVFTAVFTYYTSIPGLAQVSHLIWGIRVLSVALLANALAGAYLSRAGTVFPAWVSLGLGALGVLCATGLFGSPFLLLLLGAALWLNAAFGFRHLLANPPVVLASGVRRRAHSDRERLLAAYFDMRALLREALAAHLGERLCHLYERVVGKQIESEFEPEISGEISAVAVRVDSECRPVLDQVRRLIGRRLMPELLSAVLHRIFWMEREVLLQHVPEVASIVGQDKEEAIDARELLVQLPLFSGLEEKHRLEVASLFRRRTAPEGKKVIRQGEPGHEFFVIASGAASVEVEDSWGEQRTVAYLSEGDYFGEVALLQNVPRTATVVAQTPLDLFVLGRRDFRTHLTDVSTLSDSIKVSVDRVNVLRGISLFRRLPPALLSKVASWFEPCRVKPGEVIIREGERGEAFYVILKGSCQVVCQRDETTEEELATLGRGEFFGEISLILQRSTTATVRALEATDLLRLPEDRFLAIFRENTFFAESVSRMASRRVIDTSGRKAS